jgi:hypothetical protein
MRKILFISAAVLLMAACQKEPYTSDNDNSYLVYTSPGKDVNFTQYKTFDMTDSLLVIGQGSKPKYVRNDAVKAILLDFRRNMEARGFVYAPDAEAADLGVQLTYVIKTERFVQFYSDPYWWLDYPGYWPSGYWGNWNGYYMPRPVTYTYTTNALLTDIVNLTGEQKDGTPLEILWTSYIGGPAGSTIQGDVTRMTEAIDQAFKQSEYLKNK